MLPALILASHSITGIMCKGNNWSIKGSTKNLYIFYPEMVLMTVWGLHGQKAYKVCVHVYFFYANPFVVSSCTCMYGI